MKAHTHPPQEFLTTRLRRERALSMYSTTEWMFDEGKLLSTRFFNQSFHSALSSSLREQRTKKEKSQIKIDWRDVTDDGSSNKLLSVECKALNF